MDSFFQVFLSAIVVFSGIPMGVYILFVAPEESKPGKKWFLIIMSILFSLILFFSIQSTVLKLLASIAGLWGMLFIPKFIKTTNRKRYFSMSLAFVVGIIFYLANSIFISTLCMLFFAAHSSYMLEFKAKDVNIKLGKVRHKLNYLWEQIWPNASFFIAIIIAGVF